MKPPGFERLFSKAFRVSLEPTSSVAALARQMAGVEAVAGVIRKKRMRIA
jgi:hypothetical protein